MKRDAVIGWTLGLAVAAQGVILIAMADLGGSAAVQCLLVALALGALTQQGWRHRLRLDHRLDMLLVMMALGGLGMLIGWWIDRTLAARAMAAMGEHAHHAGHNHALSYASILKATFSWMTGLMLVGSVPPSIWLTRCAALARQDARRGDWRRWVALHLLGNLGMIVGMIVVGKLLSGPLAGAIGSMVVAMHLAMLIGMLVGMHAVQFVAEAAMGVRPWRAVAVEGNAEAAAREE